MPVILSPGGSTVDTEWIGRAIPSEQALPRPSTYDRVSKVDNGRLPIFGEVTGVFGGTFEAQATTNPLSATADRDIAFGTDDGRERPSQSPVLTDFFLQTGTVDQEHLAFRFADIPIQQGAQVVQAEFYSTLGNSTKNDAQGSWFGHDADDSATFTTTNADIDGRTKTTASVAWDTNDLGNAGDRIKTPNLAAIIQEIVDRPGWQPGNSISLLYVVSGTTDVLQISAYENNAAYPVPALHLEYRLIPQVTGVATGAFGGNFVADGEVTGATIVNVDQAIETNIANQIGDIEIISVATETETATAITKRKLKAQEQTTETETSQAINESKSRVLGQVTETETAQSLHDVRPVAQVTELNQGQAITLVRAYTVNRADEANTAFFIHEAKSVAQVVETETAQLVRPISIYAIGQVTETNTAFFISEAKTTGQVVETETAQIVRPVSIYAVSFATETETSFFIHEAKTLGQVVESETANIIASTETTFVNVNQATETETARSLAKIVARSIENESGRVINARKGLLGAVELEQVQDITKRKSKAVAQLVEVETSQAAAEIKSRILGQLTETETSTLISKRKLSAFDQSIEIESADTIINGAIAPDLYPYESGFQEGSFSGEFVSVAADGAFSDSLNILSAQDEISAAEYVEP